MHNHKIEQSIIKLKKRKDAKRPELDMGVVFTVEHSTQGDTDEFIAHWETIVDHIRLQPELIQSPRKEVCPEPFGKDYGKLAVLWDGTIIPCCVDYNASLNLGNAWHDRLMDIWQGHAINRLREQHINKNFPKVCENCNECVTKKAPKRFFYEADLA